MSNTPIPEASPTLRLLTGIRGEVGRIRDRQAENSHVSISPFLPELLPQIRQ